MVYNIDMNNYEQSIKIGDVATMRMYHATPFKNIDSIISGGIHAGVDGIVYLTSRPEDAVKFVAIRLEKNILVVEVEIPKADLIETFDHSEAFFKCRCYGYQNDISVNKIKKYIKYELNR